jgi:hypothetical protein
MADMIFMPYSPKITIPNWRQDLYLYRLKSKVPTIKSMDSSSNSILILNIELFQN